jgi:hypothetical protein
MVAASELGSERVSSGGSTCVNVGNERVSIAGPTSKLGNERVSHEWERVSQILNGGAMPLDLLQERVEGWIMSQAAQSPQASAL